MPAWFSKVLVPYLCILLYSLPKHHEMPAPTSPGTCDTICQYTSHTINGGDIRRHIKSNSTDNNTRKIVLGIMVWRAGGLGLTRVIAAAPHYPFRGCGLYIQIRLLCLEYMGVGGLKV